MTSQAANIMEAVELGAKTFLIDEDTCATNFMILRDEKMAQLVPNNMEPITPLLHKIKSLFNEKGIFSVIVMGGSGDSFTVADLVLWMDCYECKNVTTRAKEIAAGSGYTNDHSTFGGVAGERCPNLAALAPDGKVSVRSKSITSTI